MQSLTRIAHLSERDPVKAEGYYRAALPRGDWLVGLRDVPRLSPEQDYAADLRAAHVLEQMTGHGGSGGFPPWAWTCGSAPRSPSRCCPVGSDRAARWTWPTCQCEWSLTGR